MSDATKLEFIKNLPGIITALGAAIAAVLGVVLIRKIDHIKELTNSNMSAANTKIDKLETAITSTADARVRELEDENLRLKAERTTTVTSTSTNGPPSSKPAPIPVEMANTPDNPGHVKISEEAVKAAVEEAKEE